MLKIRLQRIGRKNRPTYRVVVAEHRRAVKGSFIERLGRYDPLITPKVFEIDTDKVMEWIKKGAQPSNTVARLLKGSGVEGMDAYIVPMADRKEKNPKEKAAPAASALKTEAEPAEVKEEAPKEEAPVEPVVEAPVEEAPVEEAPAEEAPESPVEEKSAE
ncbi:30S ribosomal protein S16 [Candidatus Peregrinibacteria bacterium CG_4_10_14_0_2_um_filter_43_11]|nr:MAG: 30S ribosomal protein S16 [Candidatus Peregrinibacteria bacterium CG_4_10_14_0_2_um_filter_43_11]